MKRRASIGLLLALLLLLPAGLTLADGPQRVIEADETVRGNVTVTGESIRVDGTVAGEMTVFGGDAEINGEVEGSMTVWGGHVTLAGQVDQDLVLFGGDLTVTEEADIDGECVVLGGQVEDARPAGERCVDVNADWGGIGTILSDVRPVPPTPPSSPDAPGLLYRFLGFLGGIGRAIGFSLTLGVLGLAVGGLFPRQLEAVQRAIIERPIASGAVGLLTGVAFPSLFVLLMLLLAIIIIIGWVVMPFVALASAIVFGALLVLGWVGMGYIVGLWLRRRLKMESVTPAVTAAAGTGMMTLFIGLLGAFSFDFISGLLVFLLAVMGLGAVVLTKFGTRAYPPLANVAAQKAPPVA